MNSATSISILYNIVKDVSGDVEAKNFVTDLLFNVLSDLHDKNIPVTEEAIEKYFAENAADFLEAAKNRVA